MPRDTLTIQEIGGLGSPELENITFTAGVAANDIEFTNDGRTVLLVKNAGASGAQTADVIAVASPYGRLQDQTVSADQGAESIAGPFPPQLWTQADGMVYVDIATEDAFSFAAVRLPILP